MSPLGSGTDSRTFRPRWFDRTKGFFWVLVVTILIWVYADLEFTDTDEFRAQVRLTAPSPDMVLLNTPDLKRFPIEASFVLSGARGSLNAYQQTLLAKGGVIEFDLSKTYGVGEHTINLVELLNRNEEVRQAGLSVVSATPALLPVTVDRALRVPDVEVQFNSTGATYSQAVVRPARMDVIVPESLWDEVLRASPGQPPRLQTIEYNFADQPLDANGPVRVRVVPAIHDVPVIPEANTVLVDVQIREQTTRKTIPVPVRLLSPASWAQDATWEKFVLEQRDPTEWLPTITVSGPVLDIERLQPTDIDAYVVLDETHKRTPESYDTETVLIRLPCDLDVELVGKPPTVQFRLAPKPAPAVP